MGLAVYIYGNCSLTREKLGKAELLILVLSSFLKNSSKKSGSNKLPDLENQFMIASLEGCNEGIVRELEMSRYTLAYLEWITNKDHLLYSRGNAAQC